MRFEDSVTINRPMDEVFDYVGEIDNLPTWRGPIVEAKQTSPGPAGAGMTGWVKAKFLGRQMEMPTEITAWDPPRSLSAKNTGGPVDLAFHYTFQPEGEGTRLTMVTEGEPGGFFKLAAPVVEQVAHRQSQSDLETLKTLLENPAQ
jgi:uncharacterized membrane protein